MVLRLSLHNALNDFLVFVNVDEANVLRIVVCHGPRLHANGFLQILSPSVVNAAASLFATLDGVGLSQLGALLDKLIGNLAVGIDFVWKAQVDVRGG